MAPDLSNETTYGNLKDDVLGVSDALAVGETERRTGTKNVSVMIE